MCAAASSAWDYLLKDQRLMSKDAAQAKHDEQSIVGEYVLL